jgi:hypothetical protein
MLEILLEKAQFSFYYQWDCLHRPRPFFVICLYHDNYESKKFIECLYINDLQPAEQRSW